MTCCRTVWCGIFVTVHSVTSNNAYFLIYSGIFSLILTKPARQIIYNDVGVKKVHAAGSAYGLPACGRQRPGLVHPVTGGNVLH